MTIDEYAEQAKREIDDFVTMYKREHEKNPSMWPMENDEAEWGEQELAARF